MCFKDQVRAVLAPVTDIDVEIDVDVDVDADVDAWRSVAVCSDRKGSDL